MALVRRRLYLWHPRWLFLLLSTGFLSGRGRKESLRLQGKARPGSVAPDTPGSVRRAILRCHCIQAPELRLTEVEGETLNGAGWREKSFRSLSSPCHANEGEQLEARPADSDFLSLALVNICSRSSRKRGIQTANLIGTSVVALQLRFPYDHKHVLLGILLYPGGGSAHPCVWGEHLAWRRG